MKKLLIVLAVVGLAFGSLFGMSAVAPEQVSAFPVSTQFDYHSALQPYQRDVDGVRGGDCFANYQTGDMIEKDDWYCLVQETVAAITQIVGKDNDDKPTATSTPSVTPTSTNPAPTVTGTPSPTEPAPTSTEPSPTSTEPAPTLPDPTNSPTPETPAPTEDADCHPNNGGGNGGEDCDGDGDDDDPNDNDNANDND